MKTKQATLLMLLVLVAAALGAQTVDAVSAPTWHIDLQGYRDHDLQTYEVRHLMDDGRDVTFESEERGQRRVYEGVAFSDIIAFVDGSAFEDPWHFDDALWAEGYDVTLTAADGYAATFSTADVAADALIFAMTRDGEPVSPRVVGDTPKNLWVKDITTIEIGVASDDAAHLREEFELDLVVNGETTTFSIDDMEDSDLYATGRGQYTTSAGSVFASEYGGLYLRDFLEQYVQIEDSTSVTFVAMDGYEMTYSGSQLTDESDGKWLLAFEENGAPIPVDPGYLRTVKIGPDSPNIPGHLSVKMIAEIRVEGEPFRDFVLQMRGPLDIDVDRSTLQSYLAFEGRTVTFTRRGETNEYTGIPLYKILAFSDDPEYTPHGQDSSIDPYNRAAALAGYTIDIVAADGFTTTVDSRDIHENDDVIIAMKKNGEPLPDREFPLIIVWDENAQVVPEGLRPVRNIAKIQLNM